MPNVNDLYISIRSSSKSAEKSIDALIQKLGLLSQGISSLNVSNLNSLSTSLGTVGKVEKSGGVSKALGNISIHAKSATKSTFSLAAAFGKFYASYFLVIRGIKGLWGSFEKTADYIEAYNYYNVSFGKIASEWKQDWDKYGYDNAEAYAESFTERMNEVFAKMSGVQISESEGLLSATGLKNLGLNIHEITQYASQLASVTNSLGQSGEASLAISKSMTMLAGDISSLFNVDYSSVAHNLQSGLIGQSRALYKYGIDITNATLETYAYELGLNKAVAEMTQMEKQQLRVLAILDQSKVSWGDLANTINSPNNQLRMLSNNLSEAGMMLGQLFVPVMEKALPVINGMTIALKRLLGDIAGFFGISMDLSSFGQGFTEMEDDVGELTDSYDSAGKAVEEWKNQLLGFDEITKMSEQDVGVNTGDLSGAIDLTEEILKATEEYEKVWNEAYLRMENQAEAIADVLENAFAPVKNIFADLFTGDFEEAGKGVSDLAIALYDVVNSGIESVDWSGIGDNIGAFLGSIEWGKILTKIIRTKFNIWDAILDVWTSMFVEAPIETLLISTIGAMRFTTVGRSVATSIMTAISSEMASMGGISGILASDVSAVGEGALATVAKGGVTIAATLATAFIGYKIGNKIYEHFATEVDEVFAPQVTESMQSVLEETGEIIDDYVESAQERTKNLEGAFESDELNVLLQKYTDLREKQELSNAETLIMQDYFSKLMEEMPEFADIINDTTLSYDEQTTAIKNLVTQLKQESMIKASQSLMSETAENYLEIERAIKRVEDSIADENFAWQKADVAKSEAKKKLGELQAEYDELISVLDEGGGASQQQHERLNELREAASLLEEEIERLSQEQQSHTLSAQEGREEIERLTGQLTVAEEEMEYYAGVINGTVDVFDTATASTSSFASETGKLPLTLKDAYEKAKSYLRYNLDISVPKNSELLSMGKTIGEKLKEGLNNGISSVKSTLSGATGTLAEWLGVSFNVGAFANGGFPEDGLFLANHGELVGQFSNGKTAVANNEQITQGIANAVYPAVYNAIVSAMGKSGSNVNVTLQGDASKIFRVVQTQANNYTRQTGEPAFLN